MESYKKKLLRVYWFLFSVNLRHLLNYGRNLYILYICLCFPDTKCLLIESYNKKPQLMHSTNTSIELRLKAWKPSTECATISAPTVKYLVHYKEVTEGPTPMPCDGMGVHCDTKASYWQKSSITLMQIS